MSTETKIDSIDQNLHYSLKWEIFVWDCDWIQSKMQLSLKKKLLWMHYHCQIDSLFAMRFNLFFLNEKIIDVPQQRSKKKNLSCNSSTSWTQRTIDCNFHIPDAPLDIATNAVKTNNYEWKLIVWNEIKCFECTHAPCNILQIKQQQQKIYRF